MPEHFVLCSQLLTNCNFVLAGRYRKMAWVVIRSCASPFLPTVISVVAVYFCNSKPLISACVFVAACHLHFQSMLLFAEERIAFRYFEQPVV